MDVLSFRLKSKYRDQQLKSKFSFVNGEVEINFGKYEKFEG